jgi:hypothetical protein
LFIWKRSFEDVISSLIFFNFISIPLSKFCARLSLSHLKLSLPLAHQTYLQKCFFGYMLSRKEWGVIPHYFPSIIFIKLYSYFILFFTKCFKWWSYHFIPPNK